MQLFNYALNISDIQRVYREGPFPSNLLKKLGITGYGVRAPIYKLEAKA
jgi:hypothetical protein